MKRLFISFDYNHDVLLKEALVGQARLPDSPFEIADWSIKTASPGWRAEALRRIRASDTVAVICGYHTDSALGVAIELAIARDEGKPYFLLAGHSNGRVRRPETATPQDETYEWTWPNLKLLVGGAR